MGETMGAFLQMFQLFILVYYMLTWTNNEQYF